MRLGELRALRVRHFNELADNIPVAESIDWRRRRKAPKSRAGARTVSLPQTVAAAVAEHVAEFCAGDPDGPLFPAPADDQAMTQSWHRLHWTRARAAAGAEQLHWHDRRHTAGTLSAQGAPRSRS